MCTPSSTPSRHLHRTSAAPCWLTLSIGPVDHRASLGPDCFCPQNCSFVYGDLDPHLKHMVAWVYPSLHPKRISISLAVFAGLTVIIFRLTDRPRYSVCNNRQHPASVATRPNNGSVFGVGKSESSSADLDMGWVYPWVGLNWISVIFFMTALCNIFLPCGLFVCLFLLFPLA